MKRLLFSLDGSKNLSVKLRRLLAAENGKLQCRNFPDGETYLRVMSPCRNRRTVVVADLSDPDPKIPKLLFLAEALRDQGARSIGLVVPYLPYMRQDKSFLPGEAVTSRSFAKLLSQRLDWVVTVDPHLHRYHFLSEIYSIPTRVVPAAPAIARWIQRKVRNPLVIGPDEESRQWVSEIAEAADAPFVVLRKKRQGDRKVVVSSSGLHSWRGHTPVLVDDIISTGHTMVETIRHLRRLRFQAPVCVGVHAIFVEGAYEKLQSAGAAKIVTCNTVPHPSNAIDLSSAVAELVESLAAKDRHDP